MKISHVVAGLGLLAVLPLAAAQQSSVFKAMPSSAADQAIQQNWNAITHPPPPAPAPDSKARAERRAHERRGARLMQTTN
ncbi:hypothetical protein PATSB16_29550 [Pandoraea thiooxydans]|uniref:Uncharacterized protein n=1 Tax=Pandoraea thiooxydans TaxID=445709 RepID=A0A0G3EVN7_9BURK|nr:hypothetical protein [Pandoraea thiooxydans]AKJ68821.1 hypothetical protein ABW99_11920 [Pandoraea thiooxydans]APR96293.1 hypothetical protein PATSB16_29550 [Pandoraea thiooxydans]